ncbi:MAG: hypothetical protein AB7T86_10155 [Xanthobacteraceae bacterium]|uniref:hypothetical protein n=1 Tax=Pseudolabrys sp. TaxID=1960880 RepID=UPI003D1092E0
MTAIRNDQGLQNRTSSQRDHDTAAANKINGARTALEGEIRDLVRRNVSQLHPSGSDAAPSQRQGERQAERSADRGAERHAEPAFAAAGDQSNQHVNALIKQVSGASIEEIDRVIRELNSVRDMLRGEGDRVTREIAGFASLSHAAITSMRVIADSIAEWKNGAQHRHEPRG